MAQPNPRNPVDDLTYDWLTVLQNKADGLNAYEKYVRDAEQANSPECVAMFRRLQEQDARLVQEVRDHFFGMIAKRKST